MRVLMVAPHFYPRGGGLETYVHNLGRWLVERHGFEVSVACSHWGRESYLEERLDGMMVYRLPHLFKVSTTPVHPLWERQIDGILARENPDVVNAHTPVPYISDMAARAAYRRKIPFVLTCHDVLGQSALSTVLEKAYFLLYGRRTLRLSTRIIVNSPQTAARFHPTLEREYKGKLALVPPAVDPRLFRPEERPRAQERTVLFVGQLFKVSRKGLNVLIDALPGILAGAPRSRLLVVGPGPIEPYRRAAQARGVADRVEFLGAFPQPEMPRYYNMADVVVLPSCKRNEGFGMSLIEAQACRKPVVGSRVGGIPFAVREGETGLLVPAGDAAALARAVVALLRDEKLAEKLGENGFRRVLREFTWEASALKTRRVYEEAVGSAAAGGP